MLVNDELAEYLVVGTIYHAFLDILGYHRWHSPISGKMVKSYVRDGTYYPEPVFAHFDSTHEADGKGEGIGQGCFTATATSDVSFIQAYNPAISPMAVLGRAEVSTCNITGQQGQAVEKAE